MLECPDLKPFFKHYRWAPMPHSQGVPVGCDWADGVPPSVPENYQQNGSWTLGEVSILFNVARQIGGKWLDIGGSTGWTAAHLAKAGCDVDSIDPMYAVWEFEERAEENLISCMVFPQVTMWPMTSTEFFATYLPAGSRYDGIIIDGCHDAPVPYEDAVNSFIHLSGRGAILFHDSRGEPVQKGARYLIDHGMEGVAYPTVHGVGLCWRGDLTVPPHPSWEL